MIHNSPLLHFANVPNRHFASSPPIALRYNPCNHFIYPPKSFKWNSQGLVIPDRNENITRAISSDL